MDQSQLCTLRSKIKGIFETVVHDVGDEAQLKRPDQTYYVEATETLRSAFEQAFEKNSCVPTEKLDGTSTIVKKYEDKVCLYVRRDRKLKKSAEKKKKCEHKNTFDINDYKEAPDNWVASDSCIDHKTGYLIPDITGNIMGWIPLDSNKLYSWHAQTVDQENNRIVVLNVSMKNGALKYELNLESLEDHEDQSFELIGTNVNGNPYKLGSKRCPIHMLIRHGCIPIYNFPENISYKSVKDWFNNHHNGLVEGVVWHCSNGEMFKSTRQHLKLKWPTEKTNFMGTPLSVKLSKKETENGFINNLFNLNGLSFESIEHFSEYYVNLK